jgi:hypothetical protein
MTLAKNPAPTTFPEFSKAQLQQAIETYRTQLTLMVQIQSVLVAGNATVIGLAISSKNAGVFLLGAFFPALIAYMGRGILRLTIPIISTAVSIEDRFGQHDSDTVIKTFLAYAVSPEYVQEVVKTTRTEADWSKRMEHLRLLPLPLLGVTRWILLLAFLFQICMPFALTRIFGWKWF